MSNYFIVGGSSGVGLQLTKQLTAAGHNVVATYFRHAPADPIDGASFFPLDVLADSPDLFFAPPEINGLVYCPGSITLKPFHRVKSPEFIDDYRLQVEGAVKVVQALLPQLKMGRASVLFYSTVAVQLGLPFHSLVAASKGAIEGLTRALAAELAPQIRVNCIAPSLTDTPLAAGLLNTPEKLEANAQRHPLKRIGTAADIASLSQFLLSGEAGWITGQIFHADGGLSTLRA